MPSSYAQSISDSNSIIASIEQIEKLPESIHFSNSLKVRNKGGHLQGIQKLIHTKNQYYVFSGSSSEYSYYSIVKTGEENIVISTNKILDKPFKHAGGFQIYNNLMAIGVEDNDAKNLSKVFIFHVENPEKPPQEPLAIIDRMGTFKRATAGCVAITIINEKVLVVVGDWDTAHLDFYRIDEAKLHEEGATLELEYSLDSKKIDKSGWIDEDWLSYQNINFIQDTNRNLYLAGMTSNAEGDDVLDLYQVDSEMLSTFSLKKIYTRSFATNAHTKFRWGAGIYQNEDGQITILSSGENIDNESILNLYQSPRY